MSCLSIKMLPTPVPHIDNSTLRKVTPPSQESTSQPWLERRQLFFQNSLDIFPLLPSREDQHRSPRRSLDICSPPLGRQEEAGQPCHPATKRKQYFYAKGEANISIIINRGSKSLFECSPRL